MDENTNKMLYLAVTTLVSISIIIIGLTYFQRGKEIYIASEKNLSRTDQSISDNRFSIFNDTTVTGNKVINTIRNYADNEFQIIVVNKNGYSKVYTVANSYTQTNSNAFDYIFPTEKYKSELVLNENKSVIGISFKGVD